MSRFEDEEEFLWEGEEDLEDEDVDVEEEDDEEELNDLIDRTEEMVETGDARQALRLWRRSLDRFADEPRAFFHHAKACFAFLEEQLGEGEPLPGDSELIPHWEAGLSSLDEALSMEAGMTDALNLLGRFHLLRENLEAALEAWERSLEADPKQESVRMWLEEAREDDDD